MKKILNFILILIGLTLVTFLSWPFIKWYWQRQLLLGVDFFLTSSFVSYLSRNFVLPPFGWKYIWYAGYPLDYGYPNLLFYLLLLPASFLGAPLATKITMVGATLLFFWLFFLLLFKLSKSLVLSTGLVFLIIWSIGFYGSLINGGSLPYYLTQAFLPLVFFPLANYWLKGEKKDLIWAAFLTGFSMLIHPAVAISYLIPMGLVFIWLKPGNGFALLQRLKKTLGYLTIVIGLGVSSFLDNIKSIYYNVEAVLENVPGKVINESHKAGYDLQLEKLQFFKLATKVNPFFYILLFSVGIVFILTLPFWRKKKNEILSLITPVLLMISYTLIFLWSYVFRLNPFQGGWYRSYWTFPFFVSLLTVLLWQGLSFRVRASFDKKIVSEAILVGLSLITIVIFSLSSFYFLKNPSLDSFFNQKVFDKFNSLTSSAFPDLLNLKISRQDQDRFKKTLVPSWLPVDDRNWRLYEIDAEVNIWWNSLFDMPLAKGYLDPPYDEQSFGYLFLRDVLFTQNEAEKRFGYSGTQAKNSALFFADWTGIKYLEGFPSEGRTTVPPPSDFFNEDLIDKKEAIVFKDTPFHEYYYEGKDTYEIAIDPHPEDEVLTYYKLKDNLVTPILQAVNEPVVALIGDPAGFELFYRSLAFLNLNSQKLIIINGPRKIDHWQLADYRRFEGIFLYQYNYNNQNKAFNILKEYVEKGGNLFIETGGDIKEKEANSLPEVFPISRTQRGSLGESWQISQSQDSILDQVKTEEFSPLILDQGKWNLSWAEPSDLRGEAILKQEGKVILAKRKLGKGTVYWSGINLPYHIESSKNTNEAEFLGNIFTAFASSKKEQADWQLDWVSAEKRKINYSNARGILFKETYYPGWYAWFDKEIFGKPLKIYPAGPMEPGFMFVFTPESSGEVTFHFFGSWTGWARTILPYLVLVVALDYLLFQGRFLAKRLAKLVNKFGEKTRKWWEKEEE